MRTLRHGAGRPSRTARAVAAGRAIGYRHLHDPLAADFLPAAERLVVRRTRPIAARRGGADVIAVATAGVSRHAALRMAAVDTAVLTAVAEGCAQIVVVGAGYDTRAWRLGPVSLLDVWELDLLDTQVAKREGLADLALGARVRFVPADLADTSIPELLAASDHDPGRPTAWVWEAVAPYLPRAAVDAVLAGIRDRSAPGSRMAMTFAHPDLLGPPALAPATGTLAAIAFAVLGEPILSTFDEWTICEALVAAGYADPVVSDAHAWARAAGLPARPDPLRAEMLVTADVR